MVDFNEATAAPPPPGGTPAIEDRTLALITHLSGIVFSAVMPLIVWLVHKDRPDKAYLDDQAKEALNFQITVLIGYVISIVLSAIAIGGALGVLVFLANLILCIVAGVKANEGIAYRYPFALRLVK